MLKWYSQSWDSTLDQVVAALQQINRYDAIVEAESGLQGTLLVFFLMLK